MYNIVYVSNFTFQCGHAALNSAVSGGNLDRVQLLLQRTDIDANKANVVWDLILTSIVIFSNYGKSACTHISNPQLRVKFMKTLSMYLEITLQNT